MPYLEYYKKSDLEEERSINPIARYILVILYILFALGVLFLGLSNY